MSFYDINPMALPENAIYYHNILMICVGVPSADWEYEEEEIWYLEKVTNARPKAFLFYKDPTLDGETDEDGEPILFEIIINQHCVVEVNENKSVCWYSTEEDTDFNLGELWKIK